MSMTSRWIENVEELERIRPQWISLLHELDLPHSFLHPDWFMVWLAKYAPEAKIKIFTTWRDDELLSFFPFEEVKQNRIRKLQILRNGYIGQSDFLAYEERLEKDLLELYSLSKEFPLIEFKNITCDSKIYKTLKNSLRKNYLLKEGLKPGDFCIDITKSWDDFQKSKNKNFKRSISKGINHANRLGLHSEFIHTPESFQKSLPRLKEVCEESWQGKNGTGTFSNATNLSFYSIICEHFAQQDRLWLFVMKQNEKVVSFMLAIRTHTRLDLLKTEYIPEYSKAAPGRQAYMNMYKKGFEEGIRLTNEGDLQTPIKLQWTTSRERKSTLTAARKNIPGGLFFLTRITLIFLARKVLGSYLKPTAEKVRIYFR